MFLELAQPDKDGFSRKGMRFDAINLGYNKSVFVGEIKYQGTCTGCYWHDPKRFNEEISK